MFFFQFPLLLYWYKLNVCSRLQKWNGHVFIRFSVKLHECNFSLLQMKADSHEFGLCSKIELTIQVFIRWAEIKEWMVEWFHSRASFFREIAIVKNHSCHWQTLKLVLNKMNVWNWRTILRKEKHKKPNRDVSSATPSSSSLLLGLCKSSCQSYF